MNLLLLARAVPVIVGLGVFIYVTIKNRRITQTQSRPCLERFETEGRICGICMDPDFSNENPVSIYCGCRFHKQCLRALIMNVVTSNVTCPVCLKAIPESSIRSLGLL